MVTEPILPTLQTVVTLLRNDSELPAMVADIGDDSLPQGTAFPYIGVGEPTSEPDDTFDKNGWAVTLMVHIYSRQTNWDEALAIKARVNALLHRQTLVANGLQCVGVREDYCNPTVEEDGVTRHVPTRYRLLWQQA